MIDTQYLKDTYKDVSAAYPDVFDYSKWVSYKVWRSYHRYSVDGEDTVHILMGSVLYIQASPGNGTEYRFCLINADGIPFPEGCRLLAMDPGHYAWKRTMWLRDETPHPTYIAEKLGMNDADAVAMAVILDRAMS